MGLHMEQVRGESECAWPGATLVLPGGPSDYYIPFLRPTGKEVVIQGAQHPSHTGPGRRVITVELRSGSSSSSPQLGGLLVPSPLLA